MIKEQKLNQSPEINEKRETTEGKLKFFQRLDEYVKENPDFLDRQLLYGKEEELTEGQLKKMQGLLENPKERSKGRSIILREYIKEEEAEQIIKWIEGYDNLLREIEKINRFLKDNFEIQYFIKNNMNWAQSYFGQENSVLSLNDNNVLKIESIFLNPVMGLITSKISSQKDSCFSSEIDLQAIKEETEKIKRISSSETIKKIKENIDLMDKIETIEGFITQEKVEMLYYEKNLSFSKIRNYILKDYFNEKTMAYITKMITSRKKHKNKDEMVKLCVSLDTKIRDLIRNPRRVRLGKKQKYALERPMGDDVRCTECSTTNKEHKLIKGKRLLYHHYGDYDEENPLKETKILCDDCHKKKKREEKKKKARLIEEERKMDEEFRRKIDTTL